MSKGASVVNIPVAGCCGCAACDNACPVGAIQMIPDEEGFLYPKVDQSLCVKCGLCEKSCPVIHPPVLPSSYVMGAVAQHQEAEVLNESTSGGLMDALCRHVIEERNGCAVGVAYDDEFMPVHAVAHSYEEAKKFRNSKYAQSSIGSRYKEIRAMLEEKKTVLFIGTPCQVAGLKTFLQRDYDGLITADIVCRSIPSPLLWKAYLKWQQADKGQKISRIACRKKTYGYHSGALEIDFQGGKRYAGSNRVDYFMKAFHTNICSRRSCYACQFKTPHRCSDLTVFDGWRPDVVADKPLQDNDKGYSNVIVHSLKGKEILEELKHVNIDRADPEKMFLYTGGMESKSIEANAERDTFYTSLTTVGFIDTMKKYVPVSAVDRLIEGVKPLAYWIRKKLR